MSDEEAQFSEEFDIRRRQTAIAIKPELERDIAKLAMWDAMLDMLIACESTLIAIGENAGVDFTAICPELSQVIDDAHAIMDKQ
jgi:hypothetical protein